MFFLVTKIIQSQHAKEAQGGDAYAVHVVSKTPQALRAPEALALRMLLDWLSAYLDFVQFVTSDGINVMYSL